MKLSGVCPSVRVSVCPIIHPLRVCCCGPDGEEMSIDCCAAGAGGQHQPEHGAHQQMRAVPRCQLI